VVTTAIADYLQSVYLPPRLDLAAGSAEQLRIAIRRFSVWLGREAQLPDLAPDTLLAWMQALRADGLAPATINSRRLSLLAIWNDAAERGLIPPPPRRLPRLRVPDRTPEAFTLDEMRRLMEACRRVPGLWGGVPAALCWQLAISVLWDTAARVGSLLAARMTDVDLERCLWHVPAEAVKGRRADRLFRLHPDTVALIRESVTDWPPRELLFPFPWGERQVWRHLGRILQDAELPTDRRHKFHCVRRSSESYAAAQIGIAGAAELVGHSEQVARRHYVCPRIAGQRALIDVLPRI
jgi:integrase